MKNVKLIGTLLILLQAVNGYCQTTDWIWAKHSNSPDDENGKCVEIDRQNNAYVTGSFTNSITFGSTTLVSSGITDIFLVKYDANGNVIWAISGGGSSSDYGKSVAVDRDNNAYIIGTYDKAATFGNKTITSYGYNDICIAKYSSEGDLVWVKSIGGSSYDEGTTITIDSINNLMIAGTYTSNINIDSNNFTTNASSSFFIAQFDTSGNFIWFFQPNKGEFNAIHSVKANQSGDIYATGSFIDTIGFDSVVIVGGGQFDVLLLKLDNNGRLQWARSGKGIKQAYANGMCLTDYGDIIITGAFCGSINFEGKSLTSSTPDYVDIFLVKYNFEGNVDWAVKAGGNDYDQGMAVCADLQNNVYMTGFFGQTAKFGGIGVTSKGGNDIFVAKYNSSGTPQWVKAVGDNNYDVGYGIATGTNNKVIVTGEFTGTCLFGNITLSSNSLSSDAFIAAIGLPAPPSITIISQPVGDDVCYGDPVSFEVGAIGKNIKYQWKRDNIKIPGADSSVYNITSANFTNAGTYTCELSDLTYSVTTNNAILTVDSTPVIITHPGSITKKVGQAAGFSINASGGMVNYQWLKNDVPINNATQHTYSIAAVKYSDSGNYRCAVYNDCGDTVSHVAKLTVNSSTDISDRFSESGLSIYPNPASDILFVNFPNEMNHIKIQIINTNGEILSEQIFANGNMMKVDVSKFNKGLYFLKVSCGSNIRLEKIMIR